MSTADPSPAIVHVTHDDLLETSIQDRYPPSIVSCCTVSRLALGRES